jgi:hypothetical protein
MNITKNKCTYIFLILVLFSAIGIIAKENKVSGVEIQMGKILAQYNEVSIDQLMMRTPDTIITYKKRASNYETRLKCRRDLLSLLFEVKDLSLFRIEYLVKNAGLINYRFSNGMTALHYAVQKERFDLVEAFVNCGACPNQKNVDSKTAYDLLEESDICTEEKKYVKRLLDRASLTKSLIAQMSLVLNPLPTKCLYNLQQ